MTDHHGRAATRRIDITIDRLSAVFDQLSPEQQDEIIGEQWWLIVVLVARVRAMERGEEEVRGRAPNSVADVYDRVVQPGGHPAEAILDTFKAVFAKAAL